MSTPPVVITHWDDYNVDNILKKHIVNINQQTSLGASELLTDTLGNLLPDDYDWFFIHLFSIVGMEVEGQEISLGLVYFKENCSDTLSTKFKLAKLGKWVSNTNGLHLGLERFRNFRRTVRKLRSDLIGWVPGGFLEPVVIVTRGNDGLPHILDVRILKTTTSRALTAHELYKDLTKYDPNCFVVWIKPAGAIRIYRDGKFAGHIMRLRDAGGWTTRHIARLVEIVNHIADSMKIRINERRCLKLIIEPAISLSESRQGASIVVMNEVEFINLQSNWNKENVIVACKAKHVPLESEQKINVSEAEYKNYLAQDGAVVISPTGKILGMGTYFQGGPGGRRSTAAWLPTVIDRCFTVVVSQDGSIYLHWAEKGVQETREEGVRLDFIPTSVSNPLQIDPATEKEDLAIGLPDIDTSN